EGGTGVSARAVAMDAVPGELTRADIAVSCTGATGLVLASETVAGALKDRGVPARLGADEVPPAPTRAALRGTNARSLTAADEENCPLDLAAVQSGFSVMGEAAVAGMVAATLEQH